MRLFPVSTRDALAAAWSGTPTGRRPTPPELQNIAPPREVIIDQLARIGKALNPAFDVDKFKQECAK